MSCTSVTYYVNNTESLRKTSIEQVWGRASAKKFAQDKYSKGRYFFQMYPKKVKPVIEPMKVELFELKGDSTL